MKETFNIILLILPLIRISLVPLSLNSKDTKSYFCSPFFHKAKAKWLKNEYRVIEEFLSMVKWQKNVKSDRKIVCQRSSGRKMKFRVIKKLFVKGQVAENLKQSDKGQVAENLNYKVIEELFVKLQRPSGQNLK